MYRPFMVAVISLALPVAALGAQANPDSVKLRNDCRLAAQAIRTGEPGPKLKWAWERIPGCAEAGTTAALALRRLRGDPDTAHFSPVAVVGFNVRDGELFAAALEVAGDRSATTAARVASFRLLVHQLTADRGVTYDALTEADTISGCPLAVINDRPRPMTLAPLPADAAARADAVASAVAASPQEPAVVRIAANCITRAIQQDSLWQP